MPRSQCHSVFVCGVSHQLYSFAASFFLPFHETYKQSIIAQPAPKLPPIFLYSPQGGM